MWTVFHGCGHWFHIACILPNIRDCPICKTALSEVKELGQTANNSVSNVSVPSAAEESNEDEELSDDDDDEYDQLGDDQSKTINIDTFCYKEFAIAERWSPAVMMMMMASQPAKPGNIFLA